MEVSCGLAKIGIFLPSAYKLNMVQSAGMQKIEILPDGNHSAGGNYLLWIKMEDH